jgi:hypothetical protein
MYTGQVSPYDVVRMLQRDGHPTALGEAISTYGRIFKSLHVLAVIDDEDLRRDIKGVRNLQEGRHAWPRKCSTAAKDNCSNDTTKEWKTNSARSELCSIAWSCGTLSTLMKRCARKATRYVTKTWPDSAHSSENTSTCADAIHFIDPNQAAVAGRCATPRPLRTPTTRDDPTRCQGRVREVGGDGRDTASRD